MYMYPLPESWKKKMKLHSNSLYRIAEIFLQLVLNQINSFYFKMDDKNVFLNIYLKKILFWNAFKLKVYTDLRVVLFIEFIHNSWFHTQGLLCGRISHETVPHNVWQGRNKTSMEIVCSRENCTVYKLPPSEKTSLKI